MMGSISLNLIISFFLVSDKGRMGDFKKNTSTLG